MAVENALRKARAVRRPGAPRRCSAATRSSCSTARSTASRRRGGPRATLTALGGRTHEVISGLALLLADERSGVLERTAVARTSVTFRAIEGELLDWYVETEEWRGRSGGYAIQGAGATLALRIDGEVENVVGLPLSTLLDIYPELRECKSDRRV